MEGSGPILSRMDWDDEQDIVQLADHLQRQKDDYRRVFQRQAMMNIAWYLGYQDLFWSDTSGGLRAMPVQRGKANLHCNLIMPYADHQMASLAGEPIVYDVMPATGDRSDIERAELATNVLRYYQDVLQWATLEEEHDLWAVITGEAFVKVCWDPTKGSEMDLAALLGGEQAAEKYRRKRGGRMIASGDIDVYTVSPLNMFWGPPGTRFEDAEVVLEENERSIDEVSQRYDVDPDELTADSGAREVYRPDDIGPSGLRSGHREEGEKTRVRELWVRRRPDLPRGGHFVTCGQKALKLGDNRYNHGRIPYCRSVLVMAPGRLAGESNVTQLLPLQADVNANLSQGLEIRKAMASPFFLAQSGSIANPMEWDGRPGTLRHYIGTQKPEAVQGTGAPSSMLNALKITQGYMEDIIGAHDVTRAKMPTGVKSGRAISLLQEKDEQRLARMRRRRSQTFRQVGMLMLQTAAQFISEERLIRISSDEDTSKARWMRGSDLLGPARGTGVDYFDVRVTTSGLPVSRTAQLDLVDMLLERGVLNPQNPEHHRLILRALNLGSVRRDADPTRKDVDNQYFECEQMQQGRWIAPRDFDDHDAHLRELNDYRKTGSFRTLPVHIQTLFQMHEIEHMKLMAAKSLRAEMIAAQVRAEMFGPPQPQIAPPGQGGGGNSDATRLALAPGGDTQAA